jgi:transcriptional regulator with XRE-family HTH domain
MNGAEVRAIRLSKGMTQVEAAALVGVTSTAWAHWEQGVKILNRSHEIMLLLVRDGKLKPPKKPRSGTGRIKLAGRVSKGEALKINRRGKAVRK